MKKIMEKLHRGRPVPSTETLSTQIGTMAKVYTIEHCIADRITIYQDVEKLPWHIETTAEWYFWILKSPILLFSAVKSFGTLLKLSFQRGVVFLVWLKKLECGVVF